MKISNVDGRFALGDDRRDIGSATDAFGSRGELLYERWEEFQVWAASSTAGKSLDGPLSAPVERPRQIFAIGLNYREHAEETSTALPDEPVVFTKYASSITGPVSSVKLPGDSVDWEAELVVIIGIGGRNIPRASALDHVAAFTIGQDISFRGMQRLGQTPQWSLSKSFEGFSPIGPVAVSLDEIDDPFDLAISCDRNGEVVQSSSTSMMLFPADELIERLSAVVELYPGDLIFTGTPSGVGMGRTPQVFLESGDVLTTRIQGIGELVQRIR